MRTSIIVRGLAAVTAVWLAGGWTLHGQERAEVTKAQVDQWMEELSNWGRWGADDQLGAVNLITQAKRRQALALATTGEVVSLSLTRSYTDRSCRSGRRLPCRSRVRIN